MYIPTYAYFTYTRPWHSLAVKLYCMVAQYNNKIETIL